MKKILSQAGIKCKSTKDSITIYGKNKKDTSNNPIASNLDSIKSNAIISDDEPQKDISQIEKREIKIKLYPTLFQTFLKLNYHHIQMI